MAIDSNISLTTEEVSTLRQLCDKKGQLLPLAQAKLLYRIIQVLETNNSSASDTTFLPEEVRTAFAASLSDVIEYLAQITGLMNSGNPVTVAIAPEQEPILVSLSGGPTPTETLPQSAISDSLTITSAPVSASATLGFNGANFERTRSGIIASGTPQGYSNSLACGVFSSVTPSLTNNRSIPLQLDGRGNLKATLFSGARDILAPWAHYRSATKMSDVVKNSGGTIYSLYAENLASTLRWLLLFNSRSSPQTGATPVEVFPIKSSLLLGSNFWGLGGMSFGSGISWGISTSPSSFSAAAPGDLYVAIRYI